MKTKRNWKNWVPRASEKLVAKFCRRNRFFGQISSSRLILGRISFSKLILNVEAQPKVGRNFIFIHKLDFIFVHKLHKISIDTVIDLLQNFSMFLIFHGVRDK